jgi:hypothetical protein
VVNERWTLGLDLGQSQDYSALCALQETTKPRQPIALFKWDEPERQWACRLLRRWPLGSSYTAISRDVVTLVSKPPLAKQSVLVVDNGGPGRPVCDLLRAAQPPVQLIALGICAGDSVKFTKEHGLTVAKARLIVNLQCLLQMHRLTFAAGLAEAATLQRELANYRVKVTASANEVFNAREGQHDDLVLAVSLAAWYAERSGPDAPPRAIDEGCKAIVSHPPEPGAPLWNFD